MEEGDNGQLLDMDSSDQQTSQIDSEMDSQQSSSQEYGPDNLHSPVEASSHNKKRQSTESNSSSVVGKYWRSKSLPVAYLPPLGGQTVVETHVAGCSSAINNGKTSGPSQQNNKSKDQYNKDPSSSKRGSSCRNCSRAGSTKNKIPCAGGRCCRGSEGSANSRDSVNNGKVKSLGGGSCAEQVRLLPFISKKLQRVINNA